MKPSPVTFIWDFGKRYWRLLLVFLVLVILSRIDAVVYFTGPMIYLLQMTVGCMVAAAFNKHMFFRYTIDAYTEDQDEDDEDPPGFLKDWESLDPKLKVQWTIIVLCTFFLGAAIIASNIAK